MRTDPAERIACIGNRHGADLRQVEDFLLALHTQQPSSILVSGGAAGVDSKAESTWFDLGGRVRSYRPAAWDDCFGVEVWNYGGSEESYVLPVEEQRVRLADYRSAALYRDTLIAEDADRLVAFFRRGIVSESGAAYTQSWARDREIPTYTFQAKAVAA